MKIKIKPLSVNEAYTGRRNKTQKHRDFKRKLQYILPKLETPLIKGEKIDLKIVWGFSSKGSDIDNCAKTFIDAIQKKYGFNDNLVYRLSMEKTIVAKGHEFIECSILKYENE